jgi:hypothetical protein
MNLSRRTFLRTTAGFVGALAAGCAGMQSSSPLLEKVHGNHRAHFSVRHTRERHPDVCRAFNVVVALGERSSERIGYRMYHLGDNYHFHLFAGRLETSKVPYLSVRGIHREYPEETSLVDENLNLTIDTFAHYSYGELRDTTPYHIDVRKYVHFLEHFLQRQAVRV